MATIYIDNQTWHEHSPTIYATGSLDVTRSSASNTKVHVSGTIAYFGSYSGYYNNAQGDGIGSYVVSGQGLILGDFYKSIGSWSAGEILYSQSFDDDIEFTSGILQLFAHCGYLADDTCDQGFTDIPLGNAIDISEVPYNPYTPPSIRLNSRKERGEFNKYNDFWVKYIITRGTLDIFRVVLEILDANNNIIQSYTNLSTSSGSEKTYYYTITDSRLKNGGYYKIRLAVQDGSSTIYTGTQSIFIYTKPSISIVSNTDLGVYKKTNNFNVVYKIIKGSNNITSTVLQILNPNNNNILASYTNLSKITGSNQTYNYTLSSSNCNHGSYYKIRLYVQDGTSTIYSGTSNIHTCHDPSVSNLKLYNGNTEITSYSPQNTSVNFKWTQDNNNNNLWTGESAETNKLYTTTGATEHSINPGNNSVTLTMNTSNTNTLFPVSERNVDNLTKTVTIARTHSQHPKTVTSTKSITLQLKPTKTPTGFKLLNISDEDITSTIQGKLINKNTYSTVKLKWDYPYTEIAAGIISGYRIQIYTDSSYSTQFGSTIDYDTTAYSNVKYSLNVKTQCKSLSMNYVKITPYYKDGNNNKRYDTNYLAATLFAPYGNILSPTIDYPVNNTSWHNKNFRICFNTPDDEDYDSSQSNTYRYRDFEIYINAQVAIYNNQNEISGYTDNPCIFKFSIEPEIFSTSSLSYKKKLIVNPSISNTTLLLNADKYMIKIRAAKTVADQIIWSNYSNEIIVNNVSLEPIEAGGEDYPTIYAGLNEILGESDNFNNIGDTNINIYNNLNTILGESDAYEGKTDGTIEIGGIVKAEHYNIIRDYSERLRSVYSPLAEQDITNTYVNKGDIIDHSKYLKIYNTIKRIQTSVNSYTIFDNDRQNVKFNQTIDLLDNNNIPIRGEIITADRDLRPAQLDPTNYLGRDYLLQLYDSMNLLK